MMPPMATAAATAAPVQLAGVPVPTTRSGWVVSTSWASGGIVAPPPGLPGVEGGGVVVVRAMTLTRNAAAAARVSLRSGQNRPLPQVIANPAVASRSIAVAKAWRAGTSLNRPWPVAVRCRAFTTRAAIRPRVMSVFGQKRVVLQPFMIPAATIFFTPADLRAGEVAEADRDRRRQAQRASQVDRHLALGDHGAGTEAGRRAAGHHARGCDGFDRLLVGRAVVVGEAAGGGRGRRLHDREQHQHEDDGGSSAAAIWHRVLTLPGPAADATSAIGTGAHRHFGRALTNQGQATSVSPTKPPAVAPGGTAKIAEPMCRMYSLRTSVASARWMAMNCSGERWNARKNSPASSRP